MPMRSLDDFANSKLAELDRAFLRRTLAETLREDGPWVTRDGRRLLSFSCNDYLNLSHHPALKTAATAAIKHVASFAEPFPELRNWIGFLIDHIDRENQKPPN